MFHSNPVRSLLFSTILFVLASSALVQAQYRTSIQGVVTDPAGAVVPGANLTLTNPATGEKQVRSSDPEGVFNFNALAAAGVSYQPEPVRDAFGSRTVS